MIGKTIVVLPGGYHPYHAGHYSLYKAAEEKFPDADIYLAATNDTKSRPFPFEIKKKLAQLAGVNPDQFVQVKSPFKAEEITQKYDPEQDVLIFVRSEKDRTEQPKPGGTKKDGSPSYFQSYDPESLESFNKHAYIDYLPTIEFGPGIKSATEIRNAWPRLNDKQKLAMVMSLYPKTQQNKKLSTVAVKMLDAGILDDTVQGVAEGSLNEIYKMPPTKYSSQGMTTWAYNDAVEKKLPVLYRDSNVIIFKANEDLLRYIILQDGTPALYLGLSKFLDGYKSSTVATEIAGRGKGLAQKAYLNASDILGVPIYSDTTQTDASRLGIWDKLIQQYPDRIVGYDQKTNKNLPLSLTDKDPTVNQNQPIYVDRNKKDTHKPIAPNQRYRTRLLKLLPKKQGVAEGGAETSWSDDKDIITLQDMLELTKHIKQINLPINDNLKSKLIHWDGNPEEIERINQVTVSKQFPILVMLDEKGQIDWILDGNHRLHKAIQSQAETIPAKLIKPSDLSDKAKKIFHIKEQEVEEAYSDSLTELFDTKEGVRWRGSNWSYVYGNFTSSNGIKYRIQLSSPMYGPSDLDPSSFFKNIDTSTALKAKYLEFAQIDETNTRKTGIEGTGAAAEVFGIVVNAILKYIKNNETSMIYFQAKETNRVRLYRSIIKMLLSRLPGWATKEVSGKKKSMLGNFAIYNTNLISDKPSVKEATLINDPEQGYLIVPDGGMGTWDEKSLLSNLIRKFSSMAEMIKEKRYSGLYHSLYEAGVVENMLKALVQYENFKEKQGNRPIAKGREIELKEIDFSSGLDDRNFSVKKILEIGKVVGQIEGYDVVKAIAGSQEVYFLVSDDNVHSLIGFDNGYLKNIKNVSKQSGVVRALLGYLVHIQKQPIEISHTEPLTSDGLRWVIHLIEKPRGLVITNQDNEPINVEELKNEWGQAKETGNPGTTSITITEDTKFGNKIRTNESYRHSDSLLMPFIFYTKNQDYLTEK